MMLSPSWICSKYPESATVTNSSGNGRNGTGKPHERATQTMVGAPSCGKMNQSDGSVIFLTDSYMITPVVRDWHRLKHAGTEPGLQPFYAPVLQTNISESLAYTYRARLGVGGPLTRISAIAGSKTCLWFEYVWSAL